MKLIQLSIIIGLAFLYTSLQAQNEPTPLIKTELEALHSAALLPLDTLKDRALLAQLNNYSNKIEAIDIAAMHLSKGAFKRKKKLKEEDLLVLAEFDDLIKGTNNSALSWNDSISIPMVYFPWGTAETITLIVKGTFTGYNTDQVYLSFYGTGRVHAKSLSATEAVFTFVPNKLIVDPVAEPIGYNQLELNLIQASGKNTETQRVRFLLGHYPEKLGKVTIVGVAKSTSEKEVQQKKTRTFLLNAFKEDLVDKLCTPSHSGWKVVPESIELVIESSTGVRNRDWNYRKTGSGIKTCYQIEVFNNSAGPSGKLEYYLKYDIERSVEVMSTGSINEEHELKWNELYTFPLNSESTVTLQLPNGDAKLITPQDQLNLPGAKFTIDKGVLTIDTKILPK